MIVHGIGTDEVVEIAAPRGMHVARITIDTDAESVTVGIDANHLRVLAKLAEAAADELDARAVGP